MLRGWNPYLKALLRKYYRRGWRWEEKLSEEDDNLARSIQSFRRIGDRWSWTIPLSTENVERGLEPDLVLESTTFELCSERQTSKPQTLRYGVDAAPFRHIALKYAYVFPDNDELLVTLGDRLDNYAKLGLLTMETQDQPEWFSEQDLYRDEVPPTDPDSIESLQKRPDWKTYDDDIPRWLDQWYKNLPSDQLKFPAEPGEYP